MADEEKVALIEPDDPRLTVIKGAFAPAVRR
jgi:hypothetical protein